MDKLRSDFQFTDLREKFPRPGNNHQIQSLSNNFFLFQRMISFSNVRFVC